MPRRQTRYSGWVVMFSDQSQDEDQMVRRVASEEEGRQLALKLNQAQVPPRQSSRGLRGCVALLVRVVAGCPRGVYRQRQRSLTCPPSP